MSIKPTVKYRSADPQVSSIVEEMDLTPLAKIVLANRASAYGVNPEDLIRFDPQQLDHPSSLPDIDIAAERIAKAIIQGEVIALETDHDVDGVTSHAVIYLALTQYFGVPKNRVLQYIGHRLIEGYGLSDALCNRILSNPVRPTLIITADNGSSDEPRIARLKEEGISTIVTDHHGMPDAGPPKSAVACVSPAREDSAYPDPLIAGVMVAWLTMCQVRVVLQERYGWTLPKLGGLLDFVALGTIADCVSMSRSVNNRIVVRAGLKIMNQKKRPCWRRFGQRVIDQAKEIDTGDLGFKLGPRINAVGRLGDAMVGVLFLLSENDQEADCWLDKLEEENTLRREIEADLKELAMKVGQEQVAKGRNAIQVLLGEGHAGVHGIVASRLVEAYGRPTVCFSQKMGEEGVITGSARSIEGAHVLELFKAVHARHPEIFIKFGGHAGAGGLTILESGFPVFEAAFEEEVNRCLSSKDVGPVVYCDGRIDPHIINEYSVANMNVLEPFGREFDRPIFSSEVRVKSFRWIGANKTTLKLRLTDVNGFSELEGIWFNADIDDSIISNPRQTIEIVYSPDMNWWNGRATVQVVIKQVNIV